MSWSSRLLAAVLPLLAGCRVLFPAPAPMSSLSYPAAGPAPTLLVLLPGSGDRAVTYEERGFIAAVRERGLPVDVVAANATFGYYVHQTLRDRMEEDVLTPLFAKGHPHLWLGGISMGGLGAVLLAADHPGKVEGIFMLAPYLGEAPVLDEIERAGGLAKWEPPEGRTDFQREAWRALKTFTDGAPGRPQLYLGFGEDDRFHRGHRLLAAALPPDKVFRTDGGHDWPPWQRLWGTLLDAWMPRRSAAVRAGEPGRFLE